MRSYSYRAISVQGKMTEGFVSAENTAQAYSSLKKDGYIPVELKETREKNFNSLQNLFCQKKQLSYESLGNICRQLGLIMMTGINILKGLEILAAQSPDKATRLEINRIYQEVQKGRSIAEAMSDQGSLIPKLLAGMVATGEASGTLEQVLYSMAQFYDKEHRMRQKIISASVYPVVMLFLAAGLMLFFFNFLLPQITNMLISTGARLPFLTIIVVDISEVTTHYFFVLFPGLLLIFFVLFKYGQTPRGRIQRDTLLLKLPILGRILRNAETMRFALTAHVLFRSGIPLLEGLNYVQQNLSNSLAQKAVEYAIKGLQRGETLASNLGKAEFFDAMSLQMISIGEETGELERILQEMTEYYTQEVDAGFAKLMSLIEPAMLVVIGGVVSIVILSVMLPMMNMISSLKH
ncbi:type II secretion system F family protein [Bacillota bacterium LX-D]|nr:type II secretion system F family protein [Bacillota bacterium LX-D]